MKSKSDASASVTGYLFQCRWALLAGISACKTRPSLELSIERFDDVAFEQAETPVELIQTKHHGSAGELTDFSVDLWKTIGIWSERTAENPISILDLRLSIITTGISPPGSASFKLREGRSEADVSAALKLLEAAAAKSTNHQTDSHRKKFLSLDLILRRNLVAAIHVYDNAPNILDARTQIEEECWSAAPQDHISTFVDYLEGWWFASIVAALSKPNGDSIPVQRIRSKIDELREQFKPGSLPLVEEEINVPASSSDDNRTFVRQLKLVNLSKEIISNSIRDYYRCSEQRSRWARESLLLDGETEKYDRDLVDRWSRVSLAKINEDEEVTTVSRVKCGRSIFHWANSASIPFRNRSEQWLSAGAFQNLSDQLRIGWHPEYVSLLDGEEE